MPADYRRQRRKPCIAQGGPISRPRKGKKAKPSPERRRMEISRCSCSFMCLPLLQELPSSMSTQLRRRRSSCNTSLSIARRVTNEEFECSNVTFVGHIERSWKRELWSRGLKCNTGNPSSVPGWWVPTDGRRKIICYGAKKNFGGGLEEPVGDTVDETITKDGKFCSSLGNSLKGQAVPTISSSEEITTNPSVVNPAQASANESDFFTSRVGILITAVHFLLAAGAVVLVDYHTLMANPQSAVPLRLSLPFLLSAGVTAILGYFFVPVLKYFKAAQVFRIEGPTSHKVKSGTPTMGGLFFVPVGVAIAGLFTGFKSIEVQGAMIFTLAFAGIGLMDDGLAFWRKHNYGLPGRIKLMIQVAVGMCLFFWLEFNLSYSYKIKHVVWLPAPFGPVHLGRWYLPLTAFCCAAMSNGVNLTDGLDGLAGGTAAVAFIAMSVAVLPLLPALGVFGSSMAGACFGFLVHNRYKAEVFMGDTGSLALGGALAAMACCTGMFFPLFIASGVFVIETVSVISQVLYFQLTKRIYGEGRRLFLMSPFHHHLELVGLKEPIIIIMAYSLSIALAILVVYMVVGNGIKVSTT